MSPENKQRGSIAPPPNSPGERRCPFVTKREIVCPRCGAGGGEVNVYPAGSGITECHCDSCGNHWGVRH